MHLKAVFKSLRHVYLYTQTDSFTVLHSGMCKSCNLKRKVIVFYIENDLFSKYNGFSEEINVKTKLIRPYVYIIAGS